MLSLMLREKRGAVLEEFSHACWAHEFHASKHIGFNVQSSSRRVAAGLPLGRIDTDDERLKEMFITPRHRTRRYLLLNASYCPRTQHVRARRNRRGSHCGAGRTAEESVSPA